MYTSDVSQPNFSQSSVGSVEIWIFFVFKSSKNFKRDFFKSLFFKIFTLYAPFSDSVEQYSLYSSGTCWYGVPTTQFCGKLKIHFSDIDNLFLERIIFVILNLGKFWT